MMKPVTLARFFRPTPRSQRGQMLVLFALCLLVIFGMAAIAVDGGYGLVQERRAQNAADFGAVSGTKMLGGLCSGGAAPSNAAVYQEIQFVIDQNAPAVGPHWVGHYLDGTGADTGALITNSSGTYPPVNACGVSLNTNPQWTPFVAGVLGSNSLQTVAMAKSVNNPSKGNGIGIVAMDEVQPHQVLGGGKGSFDVFGTIFANSSVPYHPWDATLPQCNPHVPKSGFGGCPKLAYTDVVDAKEGSSLILHGAMDTVSGNFPLDWCFGTTSAGYGNASGGPPNDPPIPAPPAVHTPDPFNTALCSAGNSVSLQYDQIITSNTQIADPLLPAQGGVDDPFGAGINESLCPGQSSPPSQTADLSGSGTVSLTPGEYKTPVIITGRSVVFSDCGAGYPGIFRFDKGIQLMPSSGQTVTGTNIMIATGAALPIGGNVPGTTVSGSFVQATSSGTPVPGNGAPCYPGVIKDASGKSEVQVLGSNLCGGTAGLPLGPYYGVNTYFEGCTPSCTVAGGTVDPKTIGTGTNFSTILGGQGSITVSPPSSGAYRGIALFQNRAVPANFGLDAQPDDTAAITLNGVVYNGSEPCYGFPLDGKGSCTNNATKPAINPFNFWDVGIPFRQGGVLQAGLGTGSGWGTHQSAGQVKVLGSCVVADFNTDGNTNIIIDGSKNTYTLPGVLGSGNPPISG